jgi:hypothetical protein
VQCNRVARLHGGDAPTLQRVVIAIAVEPDTAGPDCVPRAALMQIFKKPERSKRLGLLLGVTFKYLG